MYTQWMCPYCGYATKVLPGVHIRCTCGQISPPTTMIVRSIPKNSSPKELRMVKIPPKEIDEHF